MKAYLIDGTFELFRAFYSSDSMQVDGQEVGAVRRFAMNLWNHRQRWQITHAAVAFDTVIESFRNDLFPGYKTGEGIYILEILPLSKFT